MLQEKAVVITGAGEGLGRAYARDLAARGAAVLINDFDEGAAERLAANLRHEGARAFAMGGDVGEFALHERLIESCLSRFGGFNAYVSNAGILRPAPLEQASAADLEAMWRVNVLGTMAGVQAAAKHLQALGKGGSIVTVCSGSQAGDLGLGGYAATKGAVASLTYAWAMELRGTGVRLNAISPLAATAMAAQNSDLLARQQGAREEKLPPLPAPENNAPLVSYLVSDRSAHIHGQVIRLAGREICYVSHPSLMEPILTADWSFERLAEAFEGPLREQMKLGLARSDAEGRLARVANP